MLLDPRVRCLCCDKQSLFGLSVSLVSGKCFWIHMRAILARNQTSLVWISLALSNSSDFRCKSGFGFYQRKAPFDSFTSFVLSLNISIMRVH